MQKIKVLLFDLDPENRSGTELHKLLENSSHLLEKKHRIVVAREIAQAGKHLSAVLSRFSPDLTCLIYGSASRSVLTDVFAAFRGSKTAQPVIAVVNSSKAEDVAETLRHGANDFVMPPFSAGDILPRIWRWVDKADDTAIQSLKRNLGLDDFVGESPAFLAELKKIPAIAGCASNVLITGETGTGKEIYARAIHDISPRAGKRFVPVNCGAFPSEMVENELFGHVRGAYTSAETTSIGLIRGADGGTLFLDEIDSLGLLAQVKLLRFLQEKEVRPVGFDQTFKVDLRVIAATNVNLEAAVREGRFRQDLYFRLHVIGITLPALRQRPGDVALLARFFINKFTTEAGKPAKGVTPAALQMLELHDWPGNVRELENVIERSVVMSEQTMIDGSEMLLPRCTAATGADCFKTLKARNHAEFEEKYLKRLLLAHGGNISKAARAAGKDRRGLQRLIRKGKNSKRPLTAR